jgi:hypothetical protein
MEGDPCVRRPDPYPIRNILASPLVRRNKLWLSFSLNRSFDVAHRARIADRTIAITAIAATRALDARIALGTLILSVSLVLLPGAVWMHAT